MKCSRVKRLYALEVFYMSIQIRSIPMSWSFLYYFSWPLVFYFGLRRNSAIFCGQAAMLFLFGINTGVSLLPYSRIPISHTGYQIYRSLSYSAGFCAPILAFLP